MFPWGPGVWDLCFPRSVRDIHFLRPFSAQLHQGNEPEHHDKVRSCLLEYECRDEHCVDNRDRLHLPLAEEPFQWRAILGLLPDDQADRCSLRDEYHG